MTDEQKTKIISLRREGLGYTAVAKRIGISKDTVKSFCRRNGLTGEMAVRGQECQPQGGLFLHLCRVRKSIHSLWQFQTEILFPRMLYQRPFQRR